MKLSSEDSFTEGKKFIIERHKRVNFSMDRETVYNLIPNGRFAAGDSKAFYSGIIEYLDILEYWLED